MGLTWTETDVGQSILGVEYYKHVKQGKEVLLEMMAFAFALGSLYFKLYEVKVCGFPWVPISVLSIVLGPHCAS